MLLHEVLTAKREEVMVRWRANVAGTIAPSAMRAAELLDHLPMFLDEIVVALREDAGVSSEEPALDDNAVKHGEQRLRLGFSLDAVVREYGALRDAIVATAKDAGTEAGFRELNVLSDAIIGGIALAVTEYTHQRDAELLRLANEHFAFIAHELRNPLSSATVALHMLKEQGLLPTEGRPVRALERGLRHTSDLVEQTLKMARLASGIELRRQRTTIRTLFEEAETVAMSEAEAKSVELRLTADADESVHVDGRLVCSALGNLLLNAVKYSHSGSLVEVRANVAGGRLSIEIEDCCGGLPPGKVEEAFAPFVRFDERQSGFGLGLAIAKQAVDAHGGSIRVQNLPKKGCIFVLELPTS